MKKLLALVLALVMSMSLVTISNAAFDDADEIDYNEAVEVMNAVGVLVGSDGKFNPQGNLTRAQACKIIAYLDLGGKTADAIKGSGTVFTDVPATAWYAGYVEYCAGAGYVAGVGGGKFDPDANVTGIQFAKMLLCALGYKAEVEGYNSTDWSLAIARDANKADLFDALSIATSVALTREQAAQMALNALKATVVEYQGGTNVTTGDTTVTVNSVRKDVESTTAKDYNTVPADKDEKQQLVEKLYGKDLTYTSNGADAMNRPAHTWSYKNVEVGKYTDAADYTLVVTKSGKTYDYWVDTINTDFVTDRTPVGGSPVYPVSINGNDTKVTAATTAKVGDIVEIYMNSSSANQIDVLVVTQYSAAKLTGNVQTKTVDNLDKVRVPGVVNSYTETKYVKGYEGLAKDDVVYYYTADGYTYLAKAAQVDGKLTAVTSSEYVINGTKYKANGSVASIAGIATPVYNTAYNYYVDNNGYLVFAEADETATSDYVAIQSIGVVNKSGVTTSDSVEARLVAMDGTTKVVPVASVKVSGGTNYVVGAASNNLLTGTPVGVQSAVTGLVNKAFFTYTINADDEYELTFAASGDIDANSSVDKSSNYNIVNKKVADSNGTVPFNNSTVFVVAKKTAGKTYDVFVGKDNVPTMSKVTYAYLEEDGAATYVLVSEYDTKTNSGNSVFFLSATGASYNSVKEEDNTTYTYALVKAVVNGELTEVKVAASALGSISATNFGLGVKGDPTYNDKDVMTAITSDSTAKSVAYGYEFKDGVLVTGGGSFSCSADAALFYKDEDGNYVEGTVADYASDDNDAIYVVVKAATGDDASVVEYVYVQYVDDAITLPNFAFSGVDMSAGRLTYAPATKSYTGTASASDPVYVNVSNLGVTVYTCTDNTGAGASPVTPDGFGNALVGSAPASGSDDLFVKIVAVDGTADIYKITVTVS